MFEDVLRINYKEYSSISLPGIISFYIISIAVLDIAPIFPKSVSMVKEIARLLKIHGHCSKLAGKLDDSYCVW